MAKFAKKRSNTSPTISTASLPDIIFILLFFFMVVVKLRETNIKVKSITPAATELTKLEKKSLVNTCLLYTSIKAIYTTGWCIHIHQ